MMDEPIRVFLKSFVNMAELPFTMFDELYVCFVDFLKHEMGWNGIFCSKDKRKSYGFGMTWVNDNRNLNYPFKS